MPRHKNSNTGGDTQDIDDDKPVKKAKAKSQFQVILTLRDDGKLIGDFVEWIDDPEIDRRKRWTVEAHVFFKDLQKIQPQNVQTLASCLNMQIVASGLPENLQGRWITSRNGKDVQIMSGDEVRDLINADATPAITTDKK